MDYRYLQTTGALDVAARSPEHSGNAPPGPPLWHGVPIEDDVLSVIPDSIKVENHVFPFAIDDETICVAAEDPNDFALQDKLSFLIARPIRLVHAPASEITAVLRTLGLVKPPRVDALYQHFSLHEPSPSGPPPAPPPRSRRLPAQAAPKRVSDLPFGARTRTSATADSLLEDDLERGLDLTALIKGAGMLTYVVEESQRVLMVRPNGTMDVIVGPQRVWRGHNLFRPMKHYVAHPGDYLIVRYRDGRQEHIPGPAEAWFDPRIHADISREEALQIAAKEAVVVYSSKDGASPVQRRVEYGPTLFIPRPGEWLHTFSWHSSEGGSKGAVKIPKGLVFQKLWLMPDQMYHDVADVRTADDAVLTIRLMIFFELLDISTMLETTHDPIGDFVNATTSDVVDFTGRRDFESFKQNTHKLNELETYRQLTGRATQCGYRINKVVYRGYGAPDRLQQMHDQAIEARTRLQLERATEQQAQDLESFKLDSQMLRAGKRRLEQTSEVEHDLELARKKQEANLRTRETRLAFDREQNQLQSELRHRILASRDTQQRDHLAALRDLNVDLTAYLTQTRADRVIELRGQAGPTHLHVDPNHQQNPGPPASY